MTPRKSLLSSALLGLAYTLASPDAIAVCNPGPPGRPQHGGIDFILRPAAADDVSPWGGTFGGSTPSVVSAVKSASASMGNELIWLRETAGGDQVVRIFAETYEEANKTASLLEMRQDVEFMVEDRRLQPFSTPNDNDFPSQWALHGTAGINAPLAWKASEGSGTVIAIIDSGITSHADLAGKVLEGYDFISDSDAARDGDGRDADPTDEGGSTVLGCISFPADWHGTKVAGIAAAATNNARGIAGVAPAAQILPVRVSGAGGGAMTDLADAIEWASGGTVGTIPPLENGSVATVINISMGAAGSCGATEQEAITNALSRGVVVVAAAGNSTSDAQSYSPANCQGVIAVAASTDTGERWADSNYGSVALAAPGLDVYTTTNGGEDTPNPTSDVYTFFSGTSAAAPHVSGVVALMQAYKESSPQTVANKLIASATNDGNCDQCGAGRLNADAAIRSLNENRVPLASFIAVRSGSCSGKYPHYYTLTNTSTDPDGDQMTALWDYGTGAAPATTWNGYFKLFSPSTNVTLKVTDEHGKSRTINRTIEAPECMF